jgi:hypothetical protein
MIATSYPWLRFLLLSVPKSLNIPGCDSVFNFMRDLRFSRRCHNSEDLDLFQSKVLRRIYGPQREREREEVTGR